MSGTTYYQRNRAMTLNRAKDYYRINRDELKVKEAYLNKYLATSKTTHKTCFLVGDLNLNLIDYQSNAKVRDFCKFNIST